MDRVKRRGVISLPNAPLVLFLCRTNATCSIMAEAILRHLARERVRAASAGSEVPHWPVNPFVLECLRAHGIATQGLHSKVWGEFFGLERPPVRFLIALAELYAAKANWPPDTIIARWPMPDPGEARGTDIDIRLAFEVAYGRLDLCIQKFLALSLGDLNAPTLAKELHRIGEAG